MTRTITVKLTPTEFALALELSGRGNFKNISDVLRQGLLEICKQWKIKPSALAAAQLERNSHEPRFRKAPRLPLTD
jgi:Arc/MetJ-type ribon-helix-helix transcriptional regulator